MEPYYKPVVVDNDEDTKVKDDVAPANTYTNNTNYFDKRGPIMHQAAAFNWYKMKKENPECMKTYHYYTI